MNDVQIGRLAFREEGKNWNAYYALTDTLEGAIFLGSIARRFVDKPTHHQTFMRLMRECLSDMLEERLGHRPEWKEPVPAPEHERTKG